MALNKILRRTLIGITGLSALLAVESAKAQTTWNTRGLTHEQIKALMDYRNEGVHASPGDTIKINSARYIMPAQYDPFIGTIGNLTIIGNDDTMDGTVIQNHEDIGIINGLVFDVRAPGWTIKNMTIENIQSAIKAGELLEEGTMRLIVDNVLIRNTDFGLSYDPEHDGDGDVDRKGQQNVTLKNSVVRDSNVGLHQNRVDARTDELRYGVPIDNSFMNCNRALDETWFCEDGNYPCPCERIYVPGVGRTDGNTFEGYGEGQSFSDEFLCGNGHGLAPGDDTADNTIEYLVTNQTLDDLDIGINNIETDPQESFWGYVAHRGSPRVGTDGKTVTRGGRRIYFGDHDRDGDVDMKDIQIFQNYFAGDATYTIDDRAKITPLDWNGEENINKINGIRINLTDYANIVPAMTGPELND